MARGSHGADGQRSMVGPGPAPGEHQYLYGIEAYPDAFRTFRADLRKRLAADMDVTAEVAEGSPRPGGPGPGRGGRPARSGELPGGAGRARTDPTAPGPPAPRRRDGRADGPSRRPQPGHRLRPRAGGGGRPALAGLAAWYEMFPARRAPRGGTGPSGIAGSVGGGGPDGVRRRSTSLRSTPSAGPSARAATTPSPAGPADPGSPWAIGNEDGGHTAVDPALGTLQDFRDLLRAPRGLGLEIALDYALQCSPDHPWVREHPEWFHRRPDGSIRHAENPPSSTRTSIPWTSPAGTARPCGRSAASILTFWIDQGVRIFRVDNPHTKPCPSGPG